MENHPLVDHIPVNSCSKPTNPTVPTAKPRPALLVPIEVKGSSNWSISKSWNDAQGHGANVTVGNGDLNR